MREIEGDRKLGKEADRLDERERGIERTQKNIDKEREREREREREI